MMSRTTARPAAAPECIEVGIHRTPWWTFWSLWTQNGLWQICWSPPEAGRHGADDGDGQQAATLDAALRAYFDGRPEAMRSVRVDPSGWTPFFAEVYRACREIPPGHSVSYTQLAAAAGRPRAVRAAGQAMARNRVPLVIPCHRVVGASGRLGGFSAPGGIETKRRLLEWEQTA